MKKLTVGLILMLMIITLSGCTLKEVALAAPLEVWSEENKEAVVIDSSWAEQEFIDKGIGALLHKGRNFGGEKKLRNADLLWCAWGYIEQYRSEETQEYMDNSGERIGVVVNGDLIRSVVKEWFGLEVEPDPSMVNQEPGSVGVVYNVDEDKYIFSVALEGNTWRYRVEECKQYSEKYIGVTYRQTKLGQEESSKDLCHKVGLEKDENGKYVIVEYKILR